MHWREDPSLMARGAFWAVWLVVAISVGLLTHAGVLAAGAGLVGAAITAGVISARLR